MSTIEVKTASRAYPVYIGDGLLDNSEILCRHIPGKQCLVVSNETIAPLYLDQVMGSIEGKECASLVLPDGEQFKTPQSWLGIHDALITMKASRDTTVIALGGGVIGDLAGFAAATYMRGINLVQLPTTLLAQVDASVGGKTAVNLEAGKNLVGAFYQPRAVIVDTATLASLDVREYRSGLAETVKYGAIREAEFFDWLSQNSAAILQRDAAILAHLIECCVRYKAAIVAEDELEHGDRVLLNFGHTFAHAIETLTGYDQWLHGEAVAIGMVLAARLSEQCRFCPEGTMHRLRELLQAFGLPVELPPELSARSMIDAMLIDKKTLSASLRLILLREIGDAVLTTGVDESAIHALLQN